MAAKHQHRASAERTLRHGYPTHRDAIWAAMRALRTFTLDDIEHWVNDTARSGQADDTRMVHRDTVRTYAQGLERAGFIAPQGEQAANDEKGRYSARRLTLVRDIGSEAPRVTRRGERVTQGSGNERMWRTLRVLGEFNRTELLAIVNSEAPPVREDTAKDYLRYLALAGYLRQVQTDAPGRQARYRFIAQRYTGPRAPMIQRVKSVYDPNTHQVVWSRHGLGGGA